MNNELVLRANHNQCLAWDLRSPFGLSRLSVSGVDVCDTVVRTFYHQVDDAASTAATDQG